MTSPRRPTSTSPWCSGPGTRSGPSLALARSGSVGWSPACETSSGNTVSASASHRRYGRWPRSELDDERRGRCGEPPDPAAARLAGGRLRARHRPRRLAGPAPAASADRRRSVASCWPRPCSGGSGWPSSSSGRSPPWPRSCTPIEPRSCCAGRRGRSSSSRWSSPSSSGRSRCGSARSSRGPSSVRSATRSRRRASC